MDTTKLKRTKNDIFTPSEANVARRSALTKTLLEMEPSDTISYEELSTKVGFQVRDFMSILSYVKMKMVKEYKVVFGSVKGVGLVRLTSQGILRLAEGKAESMRRRTKKDVGILIAINREDLNDEEKVKYDHLLKEAALQHAISAARDDTLADKLAPFVHYPKSGPEIGPVLRQIFGSQRRKLKIVPTQGTAA